MIKAGGILIPITVRLAWATNTPCHYNEDCNERGAGMCYGDDECRGARHCDFASGYCIGDAGCESLDNSCDVSEDGTCYADYDCLGYRTCVGVTCNKKGVCEGCADCSGS